jgi:hypothetical protein
MPGIYDKLIEQLAPEARLRVEQRLKESVERELAADPGDTLARKEFSKGWFFSRSRPCGLSLRDEVALDEAVRVNDGTFTKFAERLATLKALKDR